MSRPVTIRFYAELAEELPARQLECHVSGGTEVGALIERCGVALTDVEMIVIDGESVGSDRRVGPGDRVGVYPVFESFDIESELRIRTGPLRETRFLVTAELAPLAGLLMEKGHDVLVSEAVASEIARRQGRIVLTTDSRLIVDHGLVIDDPDPAEQLRQVLGRLHLD